MPVLRVIECDICGVSETEAHTGSGWDGWGSLQGITFDGVMNPMLCPKHLSKTAEFLDTLKNTEE